MWVWAWRIPCSGGEWNLWCSREMFDVELALVPWGKVLPWQLEAPLFLLISWHFIKKTTFALWSCDRIQLFCPRTSSWHLISHVCECNHCLHSAQESLRAGEWRGPHHNWWQPHLQTQTPGKVKAFLRPQASLKSKSPSLYQINAVNIINWSVHSSSIPDSFKVALKFLNSRQELPRPPWA